MDRALVRDIRSAITMAYGLQRHEHVQHQEHIAEELKRLEKELLRIEAEVVGGHHRVVLGALAGDLDRVKWAVPASEPIVGAQIQALLDSIAQIERRLTGRTGRQPVVHSLVDYAEGLGLATSAVIARRPEARLAGGALAAACIGAAVLGDRRLGIVKALPTGAHAALDYAIGAAAIAAPFALGYARRDPTTATTHVLLGATKILATLLLRPRNRGAAAA